MTIASCTICHPYYRGRTFSLVAIAYKHNLGCVVDLNIVAITDVIERYLAKLAISITHYENCSKLTIDSAHELALEYYHEIKSLRIYSKSIS
jgi:hypothetical protein